MGQSWPKLSGLLRSLDIKKSRQAGSGITFKRVKWSCCWSSSADTHQPNTWMTPFMPSNPPFSSVDETRRPAAKSAMLLWIKRWMNQAERVAVARQQTLAPSWRSPVLTKQSRQRAETREAQETFLSLWNQAEIDKPTYDKETRIVGLALAS